MKETFQTNLQGCFTIQFSRFFALKTHPFGASAKVIITPHIGNVNNYFHLFLSLFSAHFPHHNILFQIPLTDHKSTEKSLKNEAFSGISLHQVFFPGTSLQKRGQPKPAAPDSPLSLILTLPPVPPTAFLRLQTNPLREPDHTDCCSDTAENTTQHYVACRSPTVFYISFQHKRTCP